MSIDSTSSSTTYNSIWGDTWMSSDQAHKMEKSSTEQQWGALNNSADKANQNGENNLYKVESS